MAGWSRMMRRRTSKRVTKAVDMKLLGSLSRGDLKKYVVIIFHNGYCFPAFEQVKWLNKLLNKIKMWPYVSEVIRVRSL